MSSFRIIRLSVLLIAFTLFLGNISAQNQPVYAVVSFVKSNPEVSKEHRDFIDAYKKVQLEKIAKGHMLRWAYYKVSNNNGTSDDYNYISVSFYEGNKQFASKYEEGEASQYYNTLSVKEVELLKSKEQFNNIAFEEVHLFRDMLGDPTGFPEVMWMQYFKLRKGKKIADLLRNDRNLNAASFQDNIDNDHLETFQTYQQILPSGSTSQADLVRLFGFKDFEQMLEFPVHNDMAFFKMNPSFAKVDFTLGVTTLVKEEAWQLLECSCTN